MLLIRRDKNKVLAFNTNSGRQIALDLEGGQILVDYLTDNNTVVEKSFLLEIFTELGAQAAEEFRLIDNNLEEGAWPFEVLASPVLVDLQVTTKCNLACPHCYANGVANGQHLPFAEIEKIIDQCADLGVFEIALGGGEPTLHPDFKNILKYSREKGIVANLATNGFELSQQTVLDIARYAGAVALSIEFIGADFKKRRGFEFADWLKSYKRLKRAGVKVVFQLTVSRENISKLDEILNYLRELKPYGIIFLTFKPYGRGLNFDAPLSQVEFGVVREALKKSIADDGSQVNMGYDCCLGSGLVGLGLAGDEQIKGCSALRSSCAINANLDVVPCSFSGKVLGNLTNSRLSDLWNNKQAFEWRNNFMSKITNDHKCGSCHYGKNCLGGCPEFDLIQCFKSNN